MAFCCAYENVAKLQIAISRPVGYAESRIRSDRISKGDMI